MVVVFPLSSASPDKVVATHLSRAVETVLETKPRSFIKPRSDYDFDLLAPVLAQTRRIIGSSMIVNYTML